MYLKNILFSIFIIIGFSNSSLASFISLKSNTLVFDELSKQVHAKGNVILNYNNNFISADEATIFVTDEILIASGNIIMKNEKNSVSPSNLTINLKDEQLSFEDILVYSELPNKQGKVFISIKQAISKNKNYHGKFSRFTTCDSPQPHYYLSAWKFRYHPDKSITLYGAYLKNDLSFFPFNVIPFSIPLIEWMPIPYYHYQLGKRKIVYNFPTIGKKSTPGWGYFVQNQIDYKYKNNKSSSVYIDWYETKNDRKGELGFGLQHYYDLNDSNSGSLYVYNYNFSQAGISKQNLIYKLTNQSQYKNLNIHSHYKREQIDERINSSGASDLEFKEIKLSNKNSSFPMQLNFSDLNQNTSKFDISSLTFSKTFLHDKVNLNYKNNTYSQTGRKSSTVSFSHNKQFRYGIEFSQKANFSSNKYSSSQKHKDDLLKYESSIKKTLPYDILFKLNFNTLNDLDENRVTSDSTSGANNYLFKIPEVQLSKSHTFFNNHTYIKFKSTSFLSIGRYKEILNTIQTDSNTFPKKHVNIEPNVYIIKQSIGNNISFKTPSYIQSKSLRYNFKYEQYVFKNKNTSLFKGDAQYFLNYDATYNTTYFNHVKQSLSFYRTNAHKDNNSPFYYFNKSNNERHELRKTLTLFYNKKKEKNSPYSLYLGWNNSSGYNWLRQSAPYADYQTSIDLTINSYKLLISSSKKLNVTHDYNNRPYGPLLISFNGNKPNAFKFNYSLNLDLNEIVFKDTNKVNSSQLNIEFPIGKNKDFQWYIKSSFNYKTTSSSNSFNINNYENQYISIIKHEHERIIELGYTKLTNELLFKYTFKSFPKDPFIMRRKTVNGSTNWQFEGRLKQASQERF